MSVKTYVYALTSSLAPEEFRYIGVSVDPSKRLKQHIYDTKTEKGRAYNPHKTRWITKTLLDGGSIELSVLGVYNSSEEAFEAEKVTISELKQQGHPLTNIAVGGYGGVLLEGGAYEKASVNRMAALKDYWTPERRKKHGQFLSSLWEDPEYRKINTKIKQDLHNDPEYQKAHTAGLKKARIEKDYLTKAAEGRKNSPIWKERVVSSNKKKYENPEEVERARRDAQRGWDALSPEQRKDRGFKALRTRYYNFSKKNGWVLPLADITARIG